VEACRHWPKESANVKDGDEDEDYGGENESSQLCVSPSFEQDVGSSAQASSLHMFCLFGTSLRCFALWQLPVLHEDTPDPNDE